MRRATVIDLEHLAKYTGGDEKLNAEIFRLFDLQANELVAQLQSILAARDAKSWKQVTHTLKGAARGIGAFPMADAAADLEPIDLNDQTRAADGIDVLKERSDAVIAFIRNYLAAG
jgi:HPt (histidine-containing phosphotransfer) domain-containing protein